MSGPVAHRPVPEGPEPPLTARYRRVQTPFPTHHPVPEGSDTPHSPPCRGPDASPARPRAPRARPPPWQHFRVGNHVQTRGTPGMRRTRRHGNAAWMPREPTGPCPGMVAGGDRRGDRPGMVPGWRWCPAGSPSGMVTGQGWCPAGSRCPSRPPHPSSESSVSPFLSPISPFCSRLASPLLWCWAGPVLIQRNLGNPSLRGP